MRGPYFHPASSHPAAEELRQGTLKVLNVPALRAGIPVAMVHRRNGYLSAAARSLMSMIETSWHKARV
jgi:hypothetical protein